jgi:hypothetical protein
VGTFDNCLSDQAENEVYSPLSPENKQSAELLFRSITQVSQNRKARRPRSLGEIRDESQSPLDRLKEVVQEFRKEGRSFLVTTDGDLTEESIIDLSHEALRQWDRLSLWVDQEAELQSRIKRMDEAATEWERGGRKDKSLLYSGNSLDRMNQLKPRFQPESPALAFLKASQRAEFWSHFRYRGAVAAIAIVLIGAGIGWALYFVRDAQIKQSQAQAKLGQTTDFTARQAVYNKQYEQWVSNELTKLNVDTTSPSQQKVLTSLVDKLKKTDRVYLQYAFDSQLPLAKRIQTAIAAAGYTAPGVEKVGAKAPAHNEVRYFRDVDLTDAQSIANVVKTLVNDGVNTAAFANQNNLVPTGQFELWLAANARAGDAFAVIGSFSTLAAARLAAATELPARLPGFSYAPEIYLAQNGNYALTLGGYLNSAEAAKRVQAAKTGFPQAYARTSDVWAENLLK